jgi:hypothetical protein
MLVVIVATTFLERCLLWFHNMALRFSGGPYVNTTFTCTTGTRLEIVNGIAAALPSAGWSTISSATGDYTFQSGTSPDGLSMRVRVYDPGSGNCAQVFLKTVDGFYTSQTSWLKPAASLVFHVVAGPYQFFVYTTTSQTNTNYGTWFGCGVPALPTWLVGSVTECMWLKGNTTGDSGSWCGSWRNEFMGYNGDYYSHWSGLTTYNGIRSYVDANLNNDWYYSGDMELVYHGCGFRGPSGQGVSGYQGYRWVDNTLQLHDPYISWGTTSRTADFARIQGQLWDAAIASDAFTADTAVTYGTHNGIAHTSSNTGNTVNPEGTLILFYS